VGFLPNWLTLALQASWADISQRSMPISDYRPDYRTGLIITSCSRCLDEEKTYRVIWLSAKNHSLDGRGLSPFPEAATIILPLQRQPSQGIHRLPQQGESDRNLVC
jgi:hypothetical protein